MLNITTTNSDQTLTVNVYGEIDHHSAKEIRKEADKQIMAAMPKKICLDLSKVSFMDSSGLGLIMGRYALASDIGAQICVLNPTNEVARIILMSGLDKIVPIERSKSCEK